MGRNVAALTLTIGLGLASGADAHPHVFVDTGVGLVHGPDGRVEAVEISWTYDELFSLLLLEDLGLDDDYDGVLSAAETEALQGFDMIWPEDYEGDVYVQIGERTVALGPPEPGRADLLADGRLTSTHRRPLAEPVGDGLVVKVYDPTFYTAYSILPETSSTDRADCSVAVFTPDLDSAYAQLEAALAELSMTANDPMVEVDFPPVGDRFAEEVRLSCGAETAAEAGAGDE